MVYIILQLPFKHQKGVQCLLHFTLGMRVIFVYFSLSLLWPPLLHMVLMIAREEARIRSEICGHGIKTNSKNKTNKQKKPQYA